MSFASSTCTSSNCQRSPSREHRSHCYVTPHLSVRSHNANDRHYFAYAGVSAIFWVLKQSQPARIKIAPIDPSQFPLIKAALTEPEYRGIKSFERPGLTFLVIRLGTQVGTPHMGSLLILKIDSDRYTVVSREDYFG